MNSQEHLKEAIHIALCALSSETRAKVAAELKRASGDTAMEYHRTHQPETMSILADEVRALVFFTAMVREAQSEYDELFIKGVHSSGEDGTSW